MIFNVIVTGFTKSISYKEVQIKPAEPSVSVSQSEVKAEKDRKKVAEASKKRVVKVSVTKKKARALLAKKRLVLARKKAVALKRKFAVRKRQVIAIKKKKISRSKKTAYRRLKPVIMLDTQHVGKSSNPGDRGASGYGLSEAKTTEKYMDIAATMLKKDGYAVIRAGYEGKKGEYSQRAAYAKHYDADLYFAGHLNSGGKNYSLVETSYNAKAGSIKLMNTVAKAFHKHLGTTTVKRKVLSAGERGNKCVRAAAPHVPAVILEPYFLDNRLHSKYLKQDGTKRVAEAIKESVEKMVPSAKVKAEGQ